MSSGGGGSSSDSYSSTSWTVPFVAGLATTQRLLTAHRLSPTVSLAPTQRTRTQESGFEIEELSPSAA